MSNLQINLPYSNLEEQKSKKNPFSNDRELKLSTAKELMVTNMQIGGITISLLNDILCIPNSSDIEIKHCYKCPICSGIYNSDDCEPLCLPCGHTFCNSCLHQLKASPMLGKCPYDRLEFLMLKDLLPINYSLLNRDCDPYPNLCQIHNSSLVGYCTEDYQLICGKCFFSHATHKVIELSSEEALRECKFNLEKVQILEEKLLELKRKWKTYKRVLLKDSRRLEKDCKNFIEEITKIREEIIKDIQNKCQGLIDEISVYQEMLNKRSISNAEEVISCIKFHLSYIESIKKIYPSLSISEKLTFQVSFHDFPILRELSINLKKILKSSSLKKYIVQLK